MKFIFLVGLVVTMCNLSVSWRCRRNWQCGRNGFCSRGRCVIRRPDGHSCHYNNLCRSRQCTCGTCGRKLVNGKPCSTNDNCRSGWCNPRVTFGCRGTCKPKLPDTMSCGSRPPSVRSFKRLCKTKPCKRNPKCLAFCAVGVKGFGMILNEIWKMGDNARCESGQCTCGTCGRQLESNKKCSTNDNCLSGRCRGWFTVGCRGKCK